MHTDLRRKYQDLRHSRIGPAVSLAPRLLLALSYAKAPAGNCVKWLAQSRESTNLTYDLTPENRVNLAWWVATVASCSYLDVCGFFDEIETDDELAQHIATVTAANPALNAVYDGQPRFGRRVAWYALTRALRPNLVIETGTDVGLGSIIIAAALLKNGSGTLETIDVEERSGMLIRGSYAEVTRFSVGDSVALLQSESTRVDMFIHDSLHTYSHEQAELAAVEPRLTQNAIVLSDNAHSTTACADFALKTGRRFLFVNERPANHWYPGAGVGAAWR